MRLITVSESEAGSRLDHFLARRLSQAPKSFFYKMMRKKNITLNGARCAGSERLAAGDEIRLFLAEETIEKFSRPELFPVRQTKLDVIYEDDHVALINKPAGMLSQKAGKDDVSLVEFLIAHLLEEGRVNASSLREFSPSVCNRLDRNTSGIVLAGCSLKGLQILSEAVRERTIGKYYLCVVKGAVTGPQEIAGWLVKDARSNRVTIAEKELPEGLPIRTRYLPLFCDGRLTVLEVELITGRSHQIRAHLASIGHPVAGDPKYGDPALNRKLKETAGVCGQLLHAWRLVMPGTLPEPLSYLSGREFLAEPPAAMDRVITSVRAGDRRQRKGEDGHGNLEQPRASRIHAGGSDQSHQ